MVPTLQNTHSDALIAESSAMALSRNSNCVAQDGDVHITTMMTPGLGLFNEYLLDFQTTAQSLTSTLYGELESIFSTITIHDVSACHKQSNPPPNAKSHRSAYIGPAYHWLLANLHNPYPTKDIRANIARKAKSDAKSVEAWFVDARSRIGWNNLRRTHFGNKRTDIVDAATRFFVHFDEKRPLGTTLEYDFAQMESSAKGLYADKFEETTLAAKLDVAVKDLTPKMKIQAREEELKRRKAASSYPSPRSPERSPELENLEFSPVEQEADLAITSPDALNGGKRRSRSPDGDCNALTDRPAKRIRVDSPLPAISGLPSPTPSSHELLRESASPATDATPLPTIRRKRRLSDVDGEIALKRPRCISAAPRPQAVSDPLPTTSFDFQTTDLDNWFSAIDSLSPVGLDALDDTNGLALDIFSYPDMDTPSSTTESLSGRSPLSQCVTIPRLSDDAFLKGLEISTNTFDYSELFDDYEQQLPIHQPPLYQIPHVLPVPRPPISDFAVLPVLPFVSFPSDDSLPAAQTVQPTLTQVNPDMEWSFLVEQFGDPFGDLNLLPNLDPDNDSLAPALISSPLCSGAVDPRLTSSTPSEDTTEVKSEIKSRLAAMKEEVRRLEAQIAEVGA